MAIPESIPIQGLSEFWNSAWNQLDRGEILWQCVVMPKKHRNEAAAIIKGLCKIEQRNRPVGGSWITTKVGDLEVEALVFPEHAKAEAYELGRSRISKMSITNGRGSIVACFDRGWDQKPRTKLAAQVCDLMAAGLAETIFGR